MKEFLAVRKIFDEAAEIEDPYQQKAFLDQACAGSPQIRTEVEELLGALLESRDFMTRSREAPRLNATRSVMGEEWEGRAIGPYRLLRKLGEGGVGMVYLAEQQEPVRRRVALKLLKPGMDSRTVLARFQLERRVLERLDHPSIAHVLDAGMTEHGRPYFVMEWVNGQRITEFCDHHTLSIPDRLRLFIQVCHAVQHAHQKGIIHRDLKPSNILVSWRPNSTPLPKVIDFGIAKAICTEGEEMGELMLNATNPTVDGVLGTPAYMSPEQASEGRPDLDTRTDVYSLGVLLFELLVGRPPFAMSWLVEGGLAAMRRRIQEVEPQRPSACIAALKPQELDELARANGGDRSHLANLVRGDLDWIVLKAMAKSRHLRYATANALASDLERHLSHQAVEARPPTPGYLLGRFVIRNRLLFGFMVTIAMLLAVGLAVSGWQWRRAVHAEQLQRQLRDVAEQAERQSFARAYAADMKVASVALEAGNLGQAMSLLDRYASSTKAPAPLNPAEVRGFEWHYLNHLARGQERSSFTHRGMVVGVRVDPAERWVVASAFQGEVRVWDRASGTVLRSFTGLENELTRSSIDLSRDGQRLAYLTDRSVVVRETACWNVICTNTGVSKGLGFSPDGQRLALLGAKSVRVVDASTGQFIAEVPLRRPLKRSEGAVRFCGPDAGSLAVMDEREVISMNIASRSIMWTTNVQQNALLTSMDVSPDGKRIAVGDQSGRLTLIEVEEGKVAQSVEAHPGWLLGLAYSSDGRQIATGGGDQAVRLWPVDRSGTVGASFATLRGHMNEVWAVGFSADGRHVISGGKDSLVKWWSSEPAQRPYEEVSLPTLGFLAGFSSDSQYYRVISADMDLVWLPTHPGCEPIPPLPFKSFFTDEPGTMNQICVGRDSFAVLGRNGTLQTRQLPRGELINQVALHDPTNAALANISRDGRLMVEVRLPSRSAILWDVENRRQLAVLPRYVDNESAPRSCRISFSPDGRWLAYASARFGVTLWDTQRSEIAKVLNGHAWHLYCLAFSPDSSQLASSSWDGSVVVWDVASRKMALPPLKGHFSGVNYVAFSSDGRTLVTQGGEKTIKMWNVATGTEMISVSGVSSYWACPLSADLSRCAWLDASKQKLHVSVFRTHE